jgi:hypothetical protein
MANFGLDHAIKWRIEGSLEAVVRQQLRRRVHDL